MLMVPLYAIASFISLFSLEAAFFIDAVRDVYEVCANFRNYCSCDTEVSVPTGLCDLLLL